MLLGSEIFEYEGGMYFGRGTFHARGSNVMNSGQVKRGVGDNFAFAHSPPQQELVDAVFGDAPPRANDRLRHAGPVDGFLNAGPAVKLLLYDGDKNNVFQKTTHYVVQVGWWERRSRRWRLDSYVVAAQPRTADVVTRVDRPEDRLLLQLVCRAGMTELSTELAGGEVCDSSNRTTVITLTFRTPYQETTVPASQSFTNYWWRFSTNNGTVSSGWTGWSRFYRSF